MSEAPSGDNERQSAAQVVPAPGSCSAPSSQCEWPLIPIRTVTGPGPGGSTTCPAPEFAVAGAGAPRGGRANGCGLSLRRSLADSPSLGAPAPSEATSASAGATDAVGATAVGPFAGSAGGAASPSAGAHAASIARAARAAGVVAALAKMPEGTPCRTWPCPNAAAGVLQRGTNSTAAADRKDPGKGPHCSTETGMLPEGTHSTAR